MSDVRMASGASEARVPHGRWKTTTSVAGLTTPDIVVQRMLDGPINRDVFDIYVERRSPPEHGQRICLVQLFRC